MTYVVMYALRNRCDGYWNRLKSRWTDELEVGCLYSGPDIHGALPEDMVLRVAVSMEVTCDDVRTLQPDAR